MSVETRSVDTVPRLTAGDMLGALRARYAAPEWAFVSQVANGTGWGNRRACDGLALNLWPSRGMELHGFEIKVSRNDWRRELAEPEKAEEIARYCDHWWLVVSEGKIAHLHELPPTWGLLVGPDLEVVRPAAKLDAIPLDRAFCAAVLRASLRQSPFEDELKRAVGAAHAEGFKRAKAMRNGEVEMFQRDAKYALQTIKRSLDKLRKFADEGGDVDVEK